MLIPITNNQKSQFKTMNMTMNLTTKLNDQQTKTQTLYDLLTSLNIDKILNWKQICSKQNPKTLIWKLFTEKRIKTKLKTMDLAKKINENENINKGQRKRKRSKKMKERLLYLKIEMENWLWC